MSGQISPFAIKDVELLACDVRSPLLVNFRARGLTEDQAKAMRDAREYMTSMSIYESVFNPTLTGELRVQDDMNLSSLIPFVGIETLDVQMRLYNPRTEKYRYYPYKAELDPAETVKFSIYNQTERVPKSQSTEVYRLGLASPELILSSEKRFSRAFRNMRVEDVIAEVLAYYIDTDKAYGDDISPDGYPYFEQTETPFNFIAPYISPLGAIKLATLQASAGTNKNNYFFYETLDGFYFRSLREMIIRGKERWDANPIYVRRQMGGTAGARSDDKYLSAEQIDVVTNFDMLYTSSQGYFASATIGLDVLSGKYRTTVRTLEDIETVQRLNSNQPIYPKEFSDVANPTARLFLVPTTSISAQDQKLKQLDPSISDNFLERTIAARNQELLELQTTTIRVKLAGAPNINVGTVVFIEIPQTWNNNTETGGILDIRSGLYIILAVKHTIINKTGGAYQYETVFEACSDSFA